MYFCAFLSWVFQHQTEVTRCHQFSIISLPRDWQGEEGKRKKIQRFGGNDFQDCLWQISEPWGQTLLEVIQWMRNILSRPKPEARTLMYYTKLPKSPQPPLPFAERNGGCIFSVPALHDQSSAVTLNGKLLKRPVYIMSSCSSLFFKQKEAQKFWPNGSERKKAPACWNQKLFIGDVVKFSLLVRASNYCSYLGKH